MLCCLLGESLYTFILGSLTGTFSAMYIYSVAMGYVTYGVSFVFFFRSSCCGAFVMSPSQRGLSLGLWR